MSGVYVSTQDQIARQERVLGWFESKGINRETVQAFGITVEDDGAVAFPYGNVGRKLRYGVPTGERIFRWPKGTDPVLFNREDLGKGTVFLVEGETDTMRLRQELPADKDVGVVGIPGIETWNKSMADDLGTAERVIVILDNDTDYRVAGRVDTAWRQIRADLGRKAKRVVLPRGINDVCEFFEDHNLDALRLLTEREPRPGDSRFKTTDLTVAPPPPRWIVDGMICQGDTHIFIGEMNAGKSWLTMALAVALAEQHETFLGRKIMRYGRVLYFDEENPEDMAIERLQRLGLTEKGAQNIRFIKDANIRLDKDPDTVFDEAMDYQPVLIVLDSLTRIHTEDENSAGAMARLFNDGIKPLSRMADAAVVLIHHVNKSESPSSWKRARGSSDITNYPDAGWDVAPQADGSIRMHNFKARRKAQEGHSYLSLVDKPDGSVELIGMGGYGDLF